MLQPFEEFFPLGGFSLTLLLLSVFLVVDDRLLNKRRDIYICVCLMGFYSVLLLSARLGFWPLELGSYESSYALVALLLLQSAVLLFYRVYLFSVAVIFSYALYLFNVYDSAIFSLYLADGLTLLLCLLVVCICKFKESKKERV